MFREGAADNERADKQRQAARQRQFRLTSKSEHALSKRNHELLESSHSQGTRQRASSFCQHQWVFYGCLMELIAVARAEDL